MHTATQTPKPADWSEFNRLGRLADATIPDHGGAYSRCAWVLIEKGNLSVSQGRSDKRDCAQRLRIHASYAIGAGC